MRACQSLVRSVASASAHCPPRLFSSASSASAGAGAGAGSAGGGSAAAAESPADGGVQLSAAAREELGARVVSRIESADVALRRAYDGAPAGGGGAARRRAAFRSRQRGWLEVDLLLGGWASAARLAALDDAQLAAYERIIALETADLFVLLQGGGAAPPPPPPPAVRALQADPVAGPLLAAILLHVRTHPVASPEAYAQVKARMSN